MTRIGGDVMLIKNDLYELLHGCKNDNDLSLQILLDNYKPLLVKYSKINGVFDEDLYSEQRVRFIRCVKNFIENDDK